MSDIGILRPYISDHNAIFCVLHDTTVVNDQHSCIKQNFGGKTFQNFINTRRMNHGITFIIQVRRKLSLISKD